MGEHALNLLSAYDGSCIVLTTKHAKSIAVAPVFLKTLGASVIEYVVDTDQLGTFSGEIERKETALECAKRKCQWSLERLGDKVDFALASEGSFGPHPFIPFMPCNQEILYFIDRQRGFHLHISYLTAKTNYHMEKINSLERLEKFAQEAKFPSHALILRPENKEIKEPIFKGLNSQDALEIAFREAKKYSFTGNVWVETDMRAHFNPSRMDAIKELAVKLSNRLLKHCPECNLPGWGIINTEKGLPCMECGLQTSLIKAEIWGCVACAYRETKSRSDGLTEATPLNCSYCNP